VFTRYAKDGVPVICICITTKFSGSMQSAVNAREMVLEEYPDARIKVIDSTVDTVLQGLYVLEAVKLRDAGVSYEESIEKLEEIKSTGRIFFTVGDIEYLKHGGRIGKVASVAGSVLGIRPIITLKQGEIFASGIGRSRKKTVYKNEELLLSYLKECKAKPDEYSVCIGFGYDYDEALSFRDDLQHSLKKNGYEVGEIPIYQIGAAISVHTGPYPLGIGVLKKSM
jgi:DegV family protein with EDD domain